jgi:hypothetical protein
MVLIDPRRNLSLFARIFRDIPFRASCLRRAIFNLRPPISDSCLLTPAS